jgi:chromosome segregation ATPase
MLKVRKSEYEALKQELHDFKQAVNYDNRDYDKMAAQIDELNKRLGLDLD